MMNADMIIPLAAALTATSWAVLAPYPDFQRFSRSAASFLGLTSITYLRLSERLAFIAPRTADRERVRFFLAKVIG
jgi:hypothetical protein